jgi:hypothetical protein
MLLCKRAVVLYNGQRTEQSALESYFAVLYWRMRKLFRLAGVVVAVTVAQENLYLPYSGFVLATVIIRGGTLEGKAPTPESVQAAFGGATPDSCIVPSISV